MAELTDPEFVLHDLLFERIERAIRKAIVDVELDIAFNLADDDPELLAIGRKEYAETIEWIMQEFAACPGTHWLRDEPLPIPPDDDVRGDDDK